MATYYPDENDFNTFLATCGRKVIKGENGEIYIESLYLDYLGRKMYVNVEQLGSGHISFQGNINIKGVEQGIDNIINLIQRMVPFDMRIDITGGKVRYRLLCRYKNQINAHLAETEKFLVWCNLLNYMSIKNLTGGL